jgi:hypothetical protein
MSLNTHLNAFLALLEDRPEAARAAFGSLPQRVSGGDLATIQGRIQQAGENIKCKAIKEAIRMAWGQTLKLSAPTPQEVEKSNISVEDAYIKGVQDVESIFAAILKTCEETEKKLGS